MVLGKNIAHDMKSGAEGAHFFGALLLTFSFDKHNGITLAYIHTVAQHEIRDELLTIDAEIAFPVKGKTIRNFERHHWMNLS